MFTLLLNSFHQILILDKTCYNIASFVLFYMENIDLSRNFFCMSYSFIVFGTGGSSVRN
uniref:Uncharacterized protein n=1 Tax=Arundo donax TaxID=35708 RepID=A0A0A9F674_ARUDO